MKLIVVSGRSGSGKTTALHILEDKGFYCVDNMPLGLLPTLLDQVCNDPQGAISKIAVGIDARNLLNHLDQFPDILTLIRQGGCDSHILFLNANDKVLLQRFSETRRRHPLSSDDVSLAEAIAEESRILDPIATAADLSIDTTQLSIHQLRDLLKERLIGQQDNQMSILFYSFGFKRGLPAELDLVFDARCLPNPHWIQALRPLNGLDEPVIAYLDGEPLVQQMKQDIQRYLSSWLPQYQTSNRTYMTVGIGCTGGQHRSVYLAQHLGLAFKKQYQHVLVRHREIDA